MVVYFPGLSWCSARSGFSYEKFKIEGAKNTCLQAISREEANQSNLEQSICHVMVINPSGITKVVIHTENDGYDFADVTQELRFDPTMEGTDSFAT
ncbi:hypothetical protein TNCV_4952381 [Trichonephila clavipes]|nr:hypothetical protein TNCV_4952381 [Trichonephila clavipes]